MINPIAVDQDNTSDVGGVTTQREYGKTMALCSHCEGSGIFHGWAVTVHVNGVVSEHEFDTWCRWCPAGMAWREALETM